MKATFIGNGKDDPDKIVMLGYIFPKGVAVEVDEPRAIAKLMGNTHFKVEDAPRMIGGVIGDLPARTADEAPSATREGLPLPTRPPVPTRSGVLRKGGT